jgi:hypothetical protein
MESRGGLQLAQAVRTSLRSGAKKLLEPGQLFESSINTYVLIAKVSREPLAVANGRIIDGGGTLIPGIIDGHTMLPAAPLGNEVGVREGRCEASCKKRSASR